MKAAELGELFEYIEQCILARGDFTVIYLYIHMLGKIKLDASPTLSSFDADWLQRLTQPKSRNSATDALCRAALQKNMYPDLPAAHLRPIEQRVIAQLQASQRATTRAYPIAQKFERARASGWL